MAAGFQTETLWPNCMAKESHSSHSLREEDAREEPDMKKPGTRYSPQGYAHTMHLLSAGSTCEEPINHQWLPHGSWQHPHSTLL